MGAVIPISRPIIGDRERAAVLKVLDSGMLVQGPRTEELEGAFARLCGVRYAVATSSGTAALHLALLAHGVGPGDEVITTPFTFIASVNAILFVGATPVFVDVDDGTFNLDVSQVESAVTERTRAILPVHLYGQPCDMRELMALAARRDLVVIEDACQAVGAHYAGRSVGSFGTGVFSLYATKNLAAGEGGMITTDDEGVADACRLLRQHGMRRRYHHEALGYNFRMTDLHAAIALAQMDSLADMNARRAANAAFLSGHLRTVITPGVAPDRDHVWHQFTVRIGNGARDEAAERLREAGVGTGIFYPIPAHLQPHVHKIVKDGVDLPVAERLAGEVLSLPVHPSLSRDELQHIVNAVNELAPSN